MAPIPPQEDMLVNSPTDGPSRRATAADPAAEAPAQPAEARPALVATPPQGIGETPLIPPAVGEHPGGSALRRWLHGSTGRLVSSGLVVLLIAGGVIYGGDFFGIRDRLQPLPIPAARLAHGATSLGGQPVLASSPYWETVATLQGEATATRRTVTVADRALQWRITWICQQGGRLSVSDGGSVAQPLIDTACPGRGTAFGSLTGRVPLDVTASGPWQLKVEQQVDVPINDPPLAAMTAPGALVVSAGAFYGIDQQGSGRVTVYRLADSSYALRLDTFYVTPNAALDIRFSTPAAPHSDGDVANAAVAPVANLAATAGSMNFAVPPGVDPTHFGSVAIWCIQLQTAYSAATLVPSR